VRPRRHREGQADAMRRVGARLASFSLLMVTGLPGPVSAAHAAPSPEFCGPAPAATALPADAPVPESTRRMAGLLEKIRRESDPMRNPYRASEQVPFLRAALARSTDPHQRLELRWQLANQLLQAGQNEAALHDYESLAAGIRDDPAAPPDALTEILLNEAVCDLRIGERANCMLHHNADSCLFPLQGGGIHQLPQGSRAAAKILETILVRQPGDLRARWLLNIARMTAGEYPSGVPAAWRLDPRLFASDYDIKRFPDVAASAGVDVDGLAGGVVLEDFDHDGLLDLMISSWGLTDQLRLFHNNGNGTFAERTDRAGLRGETGGLNLIHCDYNNDGQPDVLVLRGAWLGSEGCYPCSLLEGRADGTFVDVTVRAGITHRAPSQAAVWFDYDGDGWIDLFIANESTSDDPHPCELYRNNRDGTFTECAAQDGVAFVGFFKGVASGDFNNDGRPDLFLSGLNQPKILLRNDGPVGEHAPDERWKFTDVAGAAGIVDPLYSFPCWFWDYDNDGWPDLMVTGYYIQDVGDIAADYLGLPNAGQRAKLYHNNRDGTFTDVSADVGLDRVLHTMGCNFGDLDNDGWLDFYAGTGDPKFSTLIPSRMFRNDGGRRFQDVTTSGGFGQLQKGHGIAFGDINNDGEQDIFSKVGGAAESDNYHSQLFANPGHGNNSIKLILEGVRTNRAAIGARIKLVVATPAGERSIYRTVGTGASFGSSPLRQEIGVGPSTVVERVEIFWPVSGTTQVVTGLAVNRCYAIREDSAAAVPVTLPHFDWPATPAPAHVHAASGN
jgi:hypothetical protein